MKHPGLRLTDLNPNCVVFIAPDSTGNVLCDSHDLVWLDDQNSLGLGTLNPNAAAMIEMSSTNQGVLYPRLTTSQRDAISSVPEGLSLYNTSENSFNFYNGERWVGVASFDGTSRITWRPGGTTEPSKNVYASWSDAYGAFTNTDGRVIVEIDPTLAIPSFPSGTWDFDNRGVLFGSKLREFTVPNGVNFKNLREISGNLFIDYTGSGSFITVSGQQFIDIKDIVILSNSGSGRLFEFNSPSGSYLSLHDSSWIFGVSGDAIYCHTNTSLQVIAFDDALLTGDHWAGGNGSIQLSMDASANVVTNPSGFPSLGVSFNDQANFVEFSDHDTFFDATNVQDAIESLDSPVKTLIYRQGDTNSNYPVFGSWQDLMIAYNAIDSDFIEIQFDDEVIGTGNLSIPSDLQVFLRTVVFKGRIDADGDLLKVVNIQNGCILRGLRGIKDGLILFNYTTDTNSPVILIDGSTMINNGLFIENYSGIISLPGANAFISVDNIDYNIHMDKGSSLINFGGNSVVKVDNNGTLNIIATNKSLISNNVFKGIYGTVNIYNDANFDYTDNSGYFSGTISVGNDKLLDIASQVGFSSTNVRFTATNTEHAIELVEVPPKLIFNAKEANLNASGSATLTYRNNHSVVAFDDTTDETADFESWMPSNYNNSGINVILAWVSETATSGNVRWSVQFELLDQAAQDIDANGFATAIANNFTTQSNSGVIAYSTISLTNSEIDGLQANKAFRLRVNRVASNGGDTMTGDAQLLRVIVEEQ